MVGLSGGEPGTPALVMSVLPLKLVVVHHQRVAFPVPARFTHPLFDGRIERRASVGWNDADLVRHFEHDQHIARRSA